MPTEKITYYALRESDEPEATGLFRERRLEGAYMGLERVDRCGLWVQDNDLLRYLVGRDTGAEKVSEIEAAKMAGNLGGSIRRRA
jgi:hypothetical protein